MESGWTDGGNGGGLDGFFVFVDDRIATPDASDTAAKRSPRIDVFVLSLRGLDKIQRDIEEFLFEHGWYYDRRKNLYKNQGKPAERIVSIPYLASAVRAIVLGDPAGSQKQRSRQLRDDDT